MNQIYDLIVIGDSKEGNQIITKVAENRTNFKIAFISSEFKNTTSHEFLNVEYIPVAVSFVDYKNRLFSIFLKNNLCLFATCLVFATGQRYKPLAINDEERLNVFNSANKILKDSKKLPIIVLHQQESDLKLALTLAKKYKYVYLCSSFLKLQGSESLLKKIEETTNIVPILNTAIKTVQISNAKLDAVEFDNYSAVKCSAIYAQTEAIPETSFIPEKLIKKVGSGYLLTTDALESTLVPKCFAIGACTKNCTTKKISTLIETILNF